MTNLTERAEKALLGALLTDPASIRQAALAEAGNFASPLHQQIHAALIPRRPGQYPGWAGPLSPNAAYARARGAATDSYLRELISSCPDPAHAGSYARMVMEASLRRQLTRYALRLRYDAATLHYELNRLRELQPEGLDLPGPHDPDHDLQRLFSHQMQLSYTLHAHARAFDPAADTPAASTTGQPGPATLTAAGPSRHALGEEQVIAGIIQHRAPAEDFPAWLPAGAFRAGPRREIYTALTSLYYRDDPVDPLTLDWELARRHSAASIQSPAATPPPPDPRYTSWLSTQPLSTEAFLDACQDLLLTYTHSLQQATPAAPHPGHDPARHHRPAPGDRQPLEPPARHLTDPGHQPRM